MIFALKFTYILIFKKIEEDFINLNNLETKKKNIRKNAKNYERNTSSQL